MRKIDEDKRNIIASIIRDYQIDHNLTQEAVARLVRDELRAQKVYATYDRASVNTWEKGRAVPDLRVVSLLANFAENESIRSLFIKIKKILAPLYEPK